MSEHERTIQSSVRGIDQFLSTYVKNGNAKRFIYEDDLKAELYAAMQSALYQDGLLYARSDWLVCKNHETHSDSVQLLHCEQKFNGSQVDLAVWDPTFDGNATCDYKKKRCCLFVEVKQKCRSEDLIKSMRGDVKKIKNWKLDKDQIALAIGFCTQPLDKLSPKLKPPTQPKVSLHSLLTTASRYTVVVCADGWLLVDL